MRFLIPALLLLASPALADDLGDDDWDIDIDLGPSGNEIEFSGGYSQASEVLTATPTITVAHPNGPVELRCVDVDKLTTRLSYTVDGSDKGQVGAFGNGIGMRTWGKGASAGVNVVVPYQGAKVSRHDIRLSVNVPTGANVKVTASKGWIQASGCGGKVTLSAGKEGAFLTGALKGFNVSAGSGDVVVVVDANAGLSSTSSITASKGNVTLVLPLSESARISARGASMNVVHGISGEVNSTSATGEIGSGGPAVTIRASGDVRITPDKE